MGALFAKTLLAGAIATIGMSLVMWAINKSGLSRADMIRALGSLLTKQAENALVPGLVTHLLSGMMFAFAYTILLNAPPLGTWYAFLIMGTLLGLFHGFVVSFMLVVFVAESHPLPDFRNVGLSVAVAHVLGHIVYGAAMGLLCFWLQIEWGILHLRAAG